MSEPIDLLEALRVSLKGRIAEADKARAERQAARALAPGEPAANETERESGDMAERIYRYQLDVDDFPEVIMPRGARVLSVAPARNTGNAGPLDLWALVDTMAPLEPRKFRVVGTGNPIGEPLGQFIGTVSLLGGSFIGHVFEAPS